MGSALKSLVALACIAVIVVSVFWWSDRAKALAAEEDRKAWVKVMREEKDCLAMVKAWDGNKRSEISLKYGDQAEDIVKNCRWLHPDQLK